MRVLVIFLLGFWAISLSASARPFTILVYNVENLSAADGKTLSEDYHPSRYSRAHLMTKLNNIARVVAQFDRGAGPDIIMFQEIERDFRADQYLFDHTGMLEQYADTTIETMLDRAYTKEVSRMPVEALLLKTLWDRGMKGYRVAAADDAPVPDSRRAVSFINVVFTRFPIGAVRTYLVPSAPAIVEVQVEVDGYPLYLFNNYWKPGATDEAAEESRIDAAQTLRDRIDEIFGVNPNADIVIAGDFNCFDDQKIRFHWARTALTDVLRVRSDKRALRGTSADLYDLWYEFPAAQRGSEVYHGIWSTFMQMFVSRGLYDFQGVQYVDESFGVAAFEGLNVTPEGEPYRWSFKGTGAGFSEHFPIFARFTTVRNNRTDFYLKVNPPRSDQAAIIPHGR